VYNDKTACLIEAKSYLRPGDVLIFHRKVRFAEGKLGRPVTHQSQLKPHVGGFSLLPLKGNGGKLAPVCHCEERERRSNLYRKQGLLRGVYPERSRRARNDIPA